MATDKSTLQELPRFDRGWTFLYLTKVRVGRDKNGICLSDETGVVSLPAAALSVLLVGPGVTMTHRAVSLLAENGCSVVWVGDGMTRFYAAGLGETRKAANLLHQATIYADEETRVEVVRRMYRMRFDVELPEDLTIQQIRGHEGVRVREAYARASKETGIPWMGRNYQKGEWKNADPVNRALSTANACLYGLVHAAIIATGFSPGIGFVHTGKATSFVYDVADLYKTDVTVPVAFHAVMAGTSDLERRVRRICRNYFFKERLIARVVPDIQRALGLKPEAARFIVHGDPYDDGINGIWDPDRGLLYGGRNYADEDGTVVQ